MVNEDKEVLKALRESVSEDLDEKFFEILEECFRDYEDVIKELADR